MRRHFIDLLSTLLLLTLVPSDSTVWKQKTLEEILGLSQDKSKPAEKECGCECDHHYDSLRTELKQLQEELKPRMLPISMLSGGCDDPGMKKTCGSSSIKVDGTEYSLKRRGHNIVVLNYDGSLWTTKSFDTWNFWSGADGEAMNTFLLSIPLGKIVLIAVQDSAERHVEAAKEGLASVGADVKNLCTEFRSSWILIGYKGTEPSWLFQDSSSRGNGPTILNTYIPLPSEYCTYSVHFDK